MVAAWPPKSSPGGQQSLRENLTRLPWFRAQVHTEEAYSPCCTHRKAVWCVWKTVKSWRRVKLCLWLKVRELLVHYIDAFEMIRFGLV